MTEKQIRDRVLKVQPKAACQSYGVWWVEWPPWGERERATAKTRIEAWRAAAKVLKVKL